MGTHDSLMLLTRLRKVMVAICIIRIGKTIKERNTDPKTLDIFLFWRAFIYHDLVSICF